MSGRETRKERKVVTCLFADLVGFTARAESLDPELFGRLIQLGKASSNPEVQEAAEDHSGESAS